AWRLWCLEHGLPEPDSLVHGRTARDMVTGAGVPAHLVDQGVERLSEIESRPGQVLSLMSGTEALLAALPAERWGVVTSATRRSEEHTSELQSRFDIVCRLLLDKKKGSGCRA